MKNWFLYFLRSMGFFKFSKFFARKKLVIVAYHGVEIFNESSFSPNLFIKRSTLEQRMEYLRNEGFHVLGLNEALKKLSDTLPYNSVVLTVDDGWYSTMVQAHDVFSEYGYPYTIYVTSYYAEKKMPVLNVVLRYIFWASRKNSIDLDLLAVSTLSGKYFLPSSNENSALYQKVLHYFESLENVDQKSDFIEKLSDLMEVDYKKIRTGRYLSLLSFSEIEYLSRQGVDIQLHTHRHPMGFENTEKLEDEIKENKYRLFSCVRNDLKHFCYPSGQYSHSYESTMKKLEILSATTCEPGFITKSTNLYYLPRFLDGENIPQIIFEAEVCGALEILRKIRSILRLFNFNCRIRNGTYQKL